MGISFPLFLFSILTMFLHAVAIGVTRLVYSKPIANARAHLCPMCSYDLSARSRDDDICPECGKTVPRRECVRLWCKLLRSWI